MSRIAMLIVLLVPAWSCGGGAGGVVDASLKASFDGSGTPPAPDLVRLTGLSSGREIEVAVSLGGPTTDDDIYAFAFDVAIGDPSIVEFVPDSAVLGTALSTTGCLGSSVLATQSQDRVVVGVTKLGGCSGNRMTASERAIVRMMFRVLAAGASSLQLAGSSTRTRLGAGGPTAYDSTSTRIDSIQFDLAPARVLAR